MFFSFIKFLRTFVNLAVCEKFTKSLGVPNPRGFILYRRSSYSIHGILLSLNFAVNGYFILKQKYYCAPQILVPSRKKSNIKFPFASEITTERTPFVLNYLQNQWRLRVSTAIFTGHFLCNKNRSNMLYLLGSDC